MAADRAKKVRKPRAKSPRADGDAAENPEDKRRVAERIKVAKLVPDKLRAKMDEMNLTLAELLRRAGAYGLTAAYTTVKAWMLGVEQPRFYDTVAIAKVLDLPLEYLADDDATSPAHFKSDLSDQERRGVDLIRHLGTDRAITILEYAADLGVEEARRRLLLMTPMPILGHSAPATLPSPAGTHRSDGDHVAPGSKVNPIPRRK